MVDVLHTVDLGVASHVIANVMWHIAVLKRAFGGATQEDSIRNLYANMQAWYKRTKAKRKVQGKITVERVRTRGGWPKLKAKAAATRHLAAYALYLVFEFGGASKEARQMRGVCEMLVRFYEILDSESQFLTSGVRAELPKLGQTLVGLYTALATQAKESGLKMWKLQPKLHLFLHLCEWQALEYGNPRYYWTYPDEDLAGSMAEVAESCHPRTMPVNALFKWLHLCFDD